MANPGPPFAGQLRYSALFVAHLAFHVLREFGISTEPLLRLLDQLGAAREPGEGENPAVALP